MNKSIESFHGEESYNPERIKKMHTALVNQIGGNYLNS